MFDLQCSTHTTPHTLVPIAYAVDDASLRLLLSLLLDSIGVKSEGFSRASDLLGAVNLKMSRLPRTRRTLAAAIWI
ncbi:hypothetical protein A2T82_31535 [Burkholderia cenocepacia]|uniref:hypothetical protein n=1 Tax=Burkholderia cenocepacia TaxID=95486 RepID=UPI00078B58A7|nr:hypothetical protein [Burkholderia cenocepacia]AMU10865.1 hypothetical protein A2T82_31535 [Burkholderia cenocepacia]